MAWIEADRVQIRAYLGFGSLWLQVDSRLESAITNVQAVVDGGTRPDNTTELYARTILTTLQANDVTMGALDSQQGAVAVGKIAVDPVRENARLKMKGRMYCHRLARVFDTEVRADIYGTAPPEGNGYPAAAFGGRSGY